MTNRLRLKRIALIMTLLAVIGAATYQVVIGFGADHEYQLARKALERGNYDEAGLHLEKYLASQPANVAAHILAAQTAQRRGDFANANVHLQLALKHGADVGEVATEERMFGIRAGDLTEADWCINFCQRNPRSPEARIVLESLIEGSLRRTQIPLAKWGIDLWLKNTSNDLDQARGLVWYGMAEDQQGKFNEANASYRRAVKLAPEYVPARIAVATALVRETPSQAAVELEWLRIHAPKNAHVRFLIASWHRNLGEHAEAAQLLDELLADEPNHMISLYQRGVVAIDLGDLRGAEGWLLRALELAPEQRDVNIALANCMRLAGRPAEAKRYQDKVREIEEPGKPKLDVNKAQKAGSEPPPGK